MRLDPNNPDDQAIAQWLEQQADMSAAVKGLILADIERLRGRGVLHQVLAEVREVKRIVSERQQSTPSQEAPPTTEDPNLAEGIDSLFG